MLDFLELEETVGKFWHRLVGTTASMPRYPDHAVAFDERDVVRHEDSVIGGSKAQRPKGPKAQRLKGPKAQRLKGRLQALHL